jgi:hypothetical protein
MICALKDGRQTKDVAMTGSDPADPAPMDPADERRVAVGLYNAVWPLMDQADRSVRDDDRMVHMAHASRYHWEQVGEAVNLSRGEWLCARVYAVLGRGEPSLHHARRVLALCQEHGIADWDLAFAYEALARAHAVSGHRDEAQAASARAVAAAADIDEDDDRELLMSDLATIPGQPAAAD